MKTHPTSSRVRGQALLMAVLLMVFAALLGATFVTVVSLNLNQTERTVSRNEAATAAEAGLKFANDQISSESMEGEAWRPEKIAPPPAADEPSYNEYYTPFERAQGWALPASFSYGANTTPTARWQALQTWKAANPTSRVFVKFPDPRGKATSGPVSLIEVSPEVSGDKAGMLRLTVIGRGEDSDSAFARLTAYKPTSANGGPFSYVRFDSNYNFIANKPLIATGTLGAATATLQTIVVNNTAGFAPGVTVAVVQGTTADYGIVSRVDATTNTLVLRAALTASYAAGPFEVRAASVLADGLPSLDADGLASTTDSTYEGTIAPVRDASNTKGLFFNNAVFLAQKLGLSLSTNGRVRSSGAISRNTSEDGLKTINTAPLSSNLAYLESNVAPLSPPALDSRMRLYRTYSVDSAPPTAGANGYGVGIAIDNRQDIETIDNRPMTNAELQRLWQRKPLTNAASGAVTHRLYYPPAETPSAWTYPASTGSLEQRGLRGWISPWEFTPRGALIELQGNTITITRDDLSDTVANRPDPAKAWRMPDGSIPSTGATTYRMVIDTSSTVRAIGAPGAEATVSAPLFNGIIYAEGNVRVRGFLYDSSNPGRKLNITIASLGNIYVEGSILRDRANPDSPASDAPRIGLVAKRNVVVNPTRFLGLPRGWQNANVQTGLNAIAITPGTSVSQLTADPAFPTNTTADLVSYVRVGDFISIGGEGRMVTAVSPTAGIKVDSPVTTIVTNDVVRLQGGRDPDVKYGLKTGDVKSSETTATNNLLFDYSTTEVFRQLTNPGQRFVREVRFDGAAPSGPLYAAFMHSAEAKRAMTLERSASPTSVEIKADANTDNIVQDAERQFTFGTYTVDLRDVKADTAGGDAVENLTTLFNTFPYPPVPDTPRWTIVDQLSTANGADAIAARRLAKIASISMNSGDHLPLALTTSVNMTWNNGSSSSSLLFGSAPSTIPTADESGLAADGGAEGFYWRTIVTGTTKGRRQVYMRPTARALSLTANSWANSISFQADTATNLPMYRLGGLRVTTSNFSAAGTYTPVPIRVQASIMAREGSFFVVPSPMMLKNAAASGTDARVGDLNVDGVVDAKDTAAATLYRRLNYRIVVRGSIVQNFSPSGLSAATLADYDSEVDADGQAVSATAKWLDAASYPTTLTSSSGAIYGSNWNTVEYQADPLPFGAGPLLPTTPDLLYVG